MTESQSLSLLMAVLMLVLVASSLISRRMAMGNLVRMLLIWLGIFAAGFIIFSFRGEFSQGWKRVKSELSPGGTTDSNGTLRVRKGEDGHFWVDVELNGRQARLLVDSGATKTGIASDLANASGLEIDETGFPMVINTANGAVEARRAIVRRLRVGPIVRENFKVIVAPNFGETSVIGMDFLSSLESWRVEGDELLLNPSRNDKSDQ